jgi:hypothetical protein
MSVLLFFVIIFGFICLLISIINSKAEKLELKDNQTNLNEQINVQSMTKDESVTKDEYFRDDEYYHDEDDEPYYAESESELYGREGYGICELDEYGRNIWEDDV